MCSSSWSARAGGPRHDAAADQGDRHQGDIQVLRDPRSLMVVLLMPLMQMALLGYGVNLDIKHVPICVFDREGSQQSEALLKAFQASPYFMIVETERNYDGVKQAIDAGRCKMAIVVPHDFSQTPRVRQRRLGAGDPRRHRRQHRQYRARLRSGGHRDLFRQRPARADPDSRASRRRSSPRSRSTASGTTRTSSAGTTSCPASSRW